jgi:transcriptional regulator with XRE-family HTH domain
MSPEQLRSLRETRGLTREQLATELGDCTASTVNKWERGMHEIPAWVEEKMLSNVQINFPLKDLHQLLDFSRESGESFEDFLSIAVREYIVKHRSKPQPQAANSGPVKTAASPSNITPLPVQHIAADAAGNDDDLQARQKNVYSSGQKQKKG